MLFIHSVQASSGLYVIKNHHVLWQRHMCSQQLLIAVLQELIACNTLTIIKGAQCCLLWDLMNADDTMRCSLLPAAHQTAMQASSDAQAERAGPEWKGSLS